MTLLFVSLILLFTLSSGFISASQTALLSLSTMQIKSFKQDRDKKRNLVAKLVSRPRDLLVTLFMLDIFINLTIQNLSSAFFGSAASWALKVGVPLALTLVIGEVIPKSLAFAYKSKVALFVAPLVAILFKLLRPIRRVLSFITSYLSSILFFFLRKEETISKDEMHHVLLSSEQEGILSKEEAQLIDGYLTLQEQAIKELLIPREEILLYHLSEPLSKLTHLFLEEQCSKIPVCEGSLEGVQGVIFVRTYFAHQSQIKEPKDLIAFLHKPYFVPEATKARVLLNHFMQSGESLAFVVNEYGSLSGIITHEDLIEAVVGSIMDRRDAKAHFTEAAKNVLIASGRMELDQFEAYFGASLPSSTNVATIGGWITERLGDIPKAGALHMYNGFLFKVLAADPNRVKSIYIRRKAK